MALIIIALLAFCNSVTSFSVKQHVLLPTVLPILQKFGILFFHFEQKSPLLHLFHIFRIFLSHFCCLFLKYFQVIILHLLQIKLFTDAVSEVHCPLIHFLYPT